MLAPGVPARFHSAHRLNLRLANVGGALLLITDRPSGAVITVSLPLR